MINLDIFDTKAKADAAKAVYVEMGRSGAVFGGGIGITVDDRRVDPPINRYADGAEVWIVVAT